MLRRLLPIAAIVIIVALTVVLRSGSSSNDQLKELRTDLEEIQRNFNLGLYGAIYDDFLPASCQSLVSRDEFASSFGEGGARDLQVGIGELRNVTFADDRVEFDLSTVVEGEPDEEAEIGDHLVFVKESGHWRDTACFGASQ